jgi:hypothetical protein
MPRKKSKFANCSSAADLAAALQKIPSLSIADIQGAKFIARLRGWNLGAVGESDDASDTNSSDVPISEPVGWYWIASSVKHGPFTEEEFNNEMERVEQETLAKNLPSPRVDEEHPDGLLHGAVHIITPSGQEWIVGCRRRTAAELANLNKVVQP